MTPLQKILVHARLADLIKEAEELAAASRPRGSVMVRNPKRDRHLLLALLGKERQRNAKLIEIMHGH